ncbi:hypothetical protein CRG98_014354 [Punica granatum]|uniref:Uncharacterized protein n=1 Tax=Punica granatum TaxID=22663 RepID=A0A2I0K9I8_PUNGR|nr:hypothetical protein CRG98_014354 [Punica granatum]
MVIPNHFSDIRLKRRESQALRVCAPEFCLVGARMRVPDATRLGSVHLPGDARRTHLGFVLCPMSLFETSQFCIAEAALDDKEDNALGDYAGNMCKREFKEDCAYCLRVQSATTTKVDEIHSLIRGMILLVSPTIESWIMLCLWSPKAVNAGPGPERSKCRTEARYGAEAQRWGRSPKVGPKPDAVNAGLEPDAGLKPNAVNACSIRKCK